MKRLHTLTLLMILLSVIAVAQVKITALKGEAFIRHGAAETWQQVSVGDILKPDDSMKMGKLSSATITTESGKKITVPEQVIVDVSDLRDLTQEDFLLKLAMENVRSVPLHDRENKLTIPRTTTMHGDQKGTSAPVTNNPEIGILQLNGTRVLFDNGYNATGVLKTKQVYRLYPALAKHIENRMLVASAFERLNLLRDALNEYRNLLTEAISPQQRSVIENKIASLKKAIEG